MLFIENMNCFDFCSTLKSLGVILGGGLNIKVNDLDEKSRQIFKIDLKIQEFNHSHSQKDLGMFVLWKIIQNMRLPVGPL